MIQVRAAEVGSDVGGSEGSAINLVDGEGGKACLQWWEEEEKGPLWEAI